MSKHERPEVFYEMSSLCFLGLQDFDCHIVYCAVIENDDATVGSGLDVYAAIFAEVVVASTEVVADCLYCSVQTVSNLMHGSVGETVFETTQFVEGYSLCHICGRF